MEIQGWLYVCDIRGIPAHQLSCGQAAPTVWMDKYCTLACGKLWILGSEMINQFFSEGDYHGNVLCETDSVSSANEDVFPLNLQRTTPSTETSHDNRKCRPPDGSLKSDAQNSLINKSFLQKKITPSIRRNRNMKPTVAGKENRPYHDVTGLVSQGAAGKQPESELGTIFIPPVIESPDMLDLSGEEDAIIRPLHHSILGKEHCFEVITVNGSRCFCCKSAGEREAWIEKIKRTLNPNLDNIRRTEYQLSLWVQEAKGIPVKKKYFCEICLDRQLYARTTSKLKDDATTFWGEHFDFTSIPQIENITVHLYKDSEKKKKKDKDYIGLVNISVQTLSNRQTLEKWYTLSTPSGKNKNNSGETMAVRIKARFQSICILPMEQYKEFAEFISSDYMVLCKLMHSALPVSKKDELSRSLVSIMHSTGTIKDFMTEIVMNDIANVEEESLIFRENTIATKAVEHYLRLIGMSYLHEALGDFVTALYESDEDCEVDGSRLPANAILEHNQKNLQMCCEIAMCKIMGSIKIFPNELREVFSVWRAQCEASGRPRIASRLITASLFLRLLCPAILNPSLFGLANELPRPNAARTLTLVAKVVQNLANRSRFGDKEEYMKFMNGFVREQWDQMGSFLNDVTDATKTSAANGFEGFIDLGRELAKLHAFLIEAFSEIDQNLLDNLERLPRILSSILDNINNPPVSTPPREKARAKHVSKSTSQLSSLDRIAEDVHLSNANDNVLVTSDPSNAPFPGHPIIQPYSLLDTMPDALTILSADNISENGSQNAVARNNGSFNNSNNSQRPSLVSMENITDIARLPVIVQPHPSPRRLSRTSKPPLSFSNPAYAQRRVSDLQRGISSPAALFSLTTDTEVEEKELQFAPTSDTETFLPTATPRDQPGTSNVVVTSENSNPIRSHTQPLSFSNPLAALRSPAAPRCPNASPPLSSSVRSNSQLETVFTTETVTYATPRSTDLSVSSARLPRDEINASIPENTNHNMGGIEHDSSDADTTNESCHSKDTLSSRPSSTTTESTATSGHNNNQPRGNSASTKPKPQPYKCDVQNNNPQREKRSGNGGQGAQNDGADPKLTAVAMSASIPVSSARRRTGLQKQQQKNTSLNSTALPVEQPHSRSIYTAFNPPKSSARALRPSAVGGSKNNRGKAQHIKHSTAHPTLVEANVVQANGEDLPPAKKIDNAASGKAVAAIAVSAGNASRVRVAKKTRPSATTTSNFQMLQQTSNKGNLSGDRYYGSRKGSYSNQRTAMQVSNQGPAGAVAFPPTTPEGPLSPEERTAQWILNSVASVAEEQASNMIPFTAHNPAKSRIASKEALLNHEDVLARLRNDGDALRARLSEAEESNRTLKQREDALLDQVKDGDRRETRLHEKMRILEEKLARHIQEKEEIKAELLHRISDMDEDQKRQREELQGVIDEKDIIVSAQRKRIACLEDANARLKRAVSELKGRSNAASHQKTTEITRRSCSCQENSAETQRSRTCNSYAGLASDQNQRRRSFQTNPRDRELGENEAAEVSFVNGECRMESLSAGSCSSSI